MSDAIEQARPMTPFPAEGSAPVPAAEAADPLAGDWSEGLRGPARALGIAEPRLLSFEREAPPSQHAVPEPPPVAPVAEVEAPDAWGAVSDEPLESAPPPASEPPSVIVNFSEPPEAEQPPAFPETTPPSPAPAFLPDITPPSPAPAFQSDAVPAESAPTPWSDATPAAAQEESTWEMHAPTVATPSAPAEEWSAPAAPAPAPAAEPVDDTWSSAPPAAEPVTEWKAEAVAGEWQEIKKPDAPALETPPAADWGTLSSGPDWSAPAAAEAAPADEAWGAQPPAATGSAWDAAPAAAAETGWDAQAPEPAVAEWAPPPPPPQATPTWNSPSVGASALAQLDSDPPDIEPAPGAAKELFGPAGTSLSGDDDGIGEPAGEVAPEGNVELAPAPEAEPLEAEALQPLDVIEDDPDLLVPVDDDAPPPPPRMAQPLAAMRPATLNALDVQGEHRVAVHTRGGRTRRGTVRDVDLSKSQFTLVPQGGGDPEPVYHGEVKAIFFMLAPGEKLKPADGGRVRVTFADGRTIEGKRDGVEAKHGFFLVPSDAARTNTRRIYVAREATTEIKEG